MPTPIREAILAAVATRLTAQLAGVAVLRAYRAALDPRYCPAVVITGTSMDADEDMSFGETQWRIGFAVAGYITAATDLAADQALSDLHARVVAALQDHDLGSGFVQCHVGTAQFELYSTEESAKPAGEFNASFEAMAMTSTKSPYAP
jgi:hypothetical protein